MDKNLFFKLTSFVAEFYKPATVETPEPSVAPEKRPDTAAKIPPGTMAKKRPGTMAKKRPGTVAKRMAPEEPQEKPEAPATETPTEVPETIPRMMSMRMASYRMADKEDPAYKKWKAEKEKWLEERKEKPREDRESRRAEYPGLLVQRPVARKNAPGMEADSMDLALPPLEQSFRERLFALIQEKHLNEVDVYKKAQIDRRLFSKIRSDADYTPSKSTIISLAVGLRLNLQEVRDLLQRAGYALSRSQLPDVIVEFFFTYGKYDLFAINEALAYYHLPVLNRVKEDD